MNTNRLFASAACVALLAVLHVESRGEVTAAAKATAAVPAQGYAKATDAVQALIGALERDDVIALGKVLGSDAADVLHSGDEVADRAERAGFLAAYRERHVLTTDTDARYTLEVGPDGWPLPIPIVRRGDGKWAFDAAAGRQELVYRRIGRNELGAIAVCQGFVEAQREYASAARDGAPAGVYATRLVSTPGKRDGLYWETGAGEPPSPVGPFVAAAAAEGYALGERSPYHGYYYRLLKAQGPSAAGGAKNYVVDGRLRAGFALVAYPADYRVSGVMTFIVNQDGRVYEKDLGPETERRATEMAAFDPDPSWTPVE